MRLARGLALAGTLLALAGCIPLPIPPHATAMRLNVAAEVQATIVPGQTTRADLLLALGEPDAIGGRTAMLSWTAVRSLGGILAVFAAPGGAGGAIAFERIEYRRLWVRFDPAGRVVASGYDARACGETSMTTPPAWVPCVGWDWVAGDRT